MATHRAPLDPDDVLDLPLPDGVSGYELVDGQPAREPRPRSTTAG